MAIKDTTIKNLGDSILKFLKDFLAPTTPDTVKEVLVKNLVAEAAAVVDGEVGAVEITLNHPTDGLVAKVGTLGTTVAGFETRVTVVETTLNDPTNGLVAQQAALAARMLNIDGTAGPVRGAIPVLQGEVASLRRWVRWLLAAVVVLLVVVAGLAVVVALARPTQGSSDLESRLNRAEKADTVLARRVDNLERLVNEATPTANIAGGKAEAATRELQQQASRPPVTAGGGEVTEADLAEVRALAEDAKAKAEDAERHANQTKTRVNFLAREVEKAWSSSSGFRAPEPLDW